MPIKSFSITIRPIFWLFAALIGFLNSFSFGGTVLWIVVILVSVLFHEIGHAVAARAYGKIPKIELVAFGGVTFYDGKGLSYLKQFIIVFCGPLFGFILFLIAHILLQFSSPVIGQMSGFLIIMRAVNLFWTVLNLLPIIPMDGGQLTRIILEAIFGFKGARYNQVVGFVVAFLVSLFFFLNQSFLIGSIFFLLAYQCFDLWRKSRILTEDDQKEEHQKSLLLAQEALQKNHDEEALAILEKIRSSSSKGMIYLKATEYLAVLQAKMQNWKTAYELLQSMRSKLSLESLCLLHKAAFLEKDYRLVEEIAGICFQEHPSIELALNSAYACAYLKKLRPAIGWLQAAMQLGYSDVKGAMQNPAFVDLKQEREFQKFLEDHSQG